MQKEKATAELKKLEEAGVTSKTAEPAAAPSQPAPKDAQVALEAEGNENTDAGTPAGGDDRSSDSDDEPAEGSGVPWISVAQGTSA